MWLHFNEYSLYLRFFFLFISFFISIILFLFGNHFFNMATSLPHDACLHKKRLNLWAKSCTVYFPYNCLGNFVNRILKFAKYTVKITIFFSVLKYFFLNESVHLKIILFFIHYLIHSGLLSSTTRSDNKICQ